MIQIAILLTGIDAQKIHISVMKSKALVALVALLGITFAESKPPLEIVNKSHLEEVMKGGLRVVMSEVLEFPTEDVWKLIAGFDTLPDYHASITTSELLEGGAVRKIGLTEDAGGGYVVERLAYFNDDSREFSYRIIDLIDCDFPLRNYQAFVRLEDLGSGKCRLHWGSDFTVEGVSDEDGDALAKAIYQGCFDGVRKVLEKQ